MKPKPTPAEVRQQILEEHRTIGELTAKVAVPGEAAAVLANLQRLLPLLERHFRGEENELSGVHENIRRRSPEQQNALLGLADEHAKLLDRLRGLTALASDVVARTAELHRLGQQLRDDLAAHEAKETALFVDSIWTDLGVGD